MLFATQHSSTGCRNCFERGQTDEFQLDGVNVGTMSHVIVGHDNSGLGAAWHLKSITVQHLGTGQKLHWEVNK